MGLDEYKRKRRFEETPEPAGKIKKTRGNSFVIQKHRATRLHYDFRLEMEGVLRSWAIPKGPTFNPLEKRLAVETEDHPIDYGDFEGVIPKGNYGAGNVIIWDNGTYEMVDPDTPEKGWKKGKLHFILKGKKVKGEWVLVRGNREPKQWIFFKVRDAFSTDKGEITEDRPESIISGRRVEEVDTTKGSKHWVTPVERELERFGMKVSGRSPLPKNIQPMLATLVDRAFDDDKWIFELKLDGIRALIVKKESKVDMFTRNGISMTNRFPTLAEAVRDIPADIVILDGEIVALDEKGHSHFHLIQPRIHLSRAKDIAAADENLPVYLYAFDVLYLNGYDLMKFPLIERKAVLKTLITESGGWIRYTDHIEKRGKDFFKAVSSMGLEGIVAKVADSAYQQSRSKFWLKIKSQQTDHFVIGGMTRPEGSRKYFGALLLGLYDRNGDFIYVGRSGGGFDDRALVGAYNELEPLRTASAPFKQVPAEIRRSIWVQPQLVCDVRFNQWTTDLKLRAPVFEGFRDDIDPKQCRLEESIPEQTEEVETSPNADKPERHPRQSLTNLDKVFWPQDGYTKGDLVKYYERIAPYLVPHLKDRPLVFKRYPDGIEGPHFYQKDAPDYTPEWIRTEKIWSPDVKRYIRHFVGADPEQLVYIANTGAITQNPWMSRVQDMDHPDYIVFDLDPVESPFSTAQQVAVELKAVLDDLGLRTYPKTSGASGIHIHLPILEHTYTYDQVRAFAEAVASIVVKRIPEIATIERVVRKRKPDAVYVDFLQNVKGKTVASVYSPRARLGAPVSTPLRWEEFRKPIDPQKFTIRTIFKRIEKYGDLFEPALTDRQDISGFLKILKA
jgi:bifunctional non-homologous end joining protein LigD